MSAAVSSAIAPLVAPSIPLGFSNFGRLKTCDLALLLHPSVCILPAISHYMDLNQIIVVNYGRQQRQFVTLSETQVTRYIAKSGPNDSLLLRQYREGEDVPSLHLVQTADAFLAYQAL